MPARAVPVEDRFDIVSTIALNRTCADLLERFALAHDGNKSAAMRHLILVHAGMEIDKAAAGAEEDVGPWRKRSLSRALIKDVATKVRGGMVRADACEAVGVTRWQLQRWNRQGLADTKEGRASIYADWVMNLARVEAEVRLEQVRSVNDAKWLLERQAPEQYGKRSVSDATITHRVTPMIVWEQLELPEARELVRLLKKASPGADEPGISAKARPIGELLPADIDADASEVPDP